MDSKVLVSLDFLLVGRTHKLLTHKVDVGSLVKVDAKSMFMSFFEGRNWRGRRSDPVAPVWFDTVGGEYIKLQYLSGQQVRKPLYP